MPLNIRLLRRVQKQILKEPRQFLMSNWFVDEGEDAEFPGNDIAKKIPNCGTAACMAGWTISLSAKKNPRETRAGIKIGYEQIGNKAARLLGMKLTREDRLGLSYPPSWGNLFVVQDWPDSFKAKWYKARTPLKRAKVASARIDAYIAEYKAKEKK